MAEMNACEMEVAVDCGPCTMGTCVANVCQLGPIATLIEPESPAADARFGSSVAVHTGKLIVGAPGAGSLGDVEIFELLQNTWMRVYRAATARDISSANYRDAQLGASVAMSSSGLTLVGKRQVGNPSLLANGQIALVTRRAAADWRYATTINTSSNSADSGYSVAIAGNTAAVGSPLHDGGRGRMTLFTLGSMLGTTNTDNYNGNQSGARAGHSIAMTTTQLIYGSPGFNSARGRCDVVLQDATFKWDDTTRIDPFMGAPGDQFGAAVAIAENVAAVGLPGRDRGATLDAGAVQLFSYNGTSWSYVVELSPSPAEQESGYGEAIAMPTNQFVIVGAPRRDAGALQDAGAVYIYQLQQNAWTMLRELRSPSPAANELFGASVSAQGNTLVVGAPGATVNGLANAGRVYLYTIP